MRPISKGYYSLTDCLECRIDLCDVARCNDTMDLEIENERRYMEWAKKNQ